MIVIFCKCSNVSVMNYQQIIFFSIFILLAILTFFKQILLSQIVRKVG